MHVQCGVPINREPVPELTSFAFDEAKCHFTQHLDTSELVGDEPIAPREDTHGEAYFQFQGHRLRFGQLRAYLVVGARDDEHRTVIVTAARYADQIEWAMLAAVAELNVDEMDSRAQRGAIRVALLWFDAGYALIDFRDDVDEVFHTRPARKKRIGVTALSAVTPGRSTRVVIVSRCTNATR